MAIAEARTTTLTQPKVARVLFDEFHSEAWTIRAEVAKEMQPTHPADSSYVTAAASLADRDFEVLPNTDRSLVRETLAGADVLVIAHPSDAKWEATTNSGKPRLADAELDAIEEFVRGGGGLIVLGETEQEKYGNNLNDLLVRFGIEVENSTVQDYEHHHSAHPGSSPSSRTAPRMAPTATASTSSPASTKRASIAPAPSPSTT